METEATAKNILLIKHLKIRRHLISFSFLPFYFRVCDFSTISEPGTGLDCGDGPERYEQEKRGWGGVGWGGVGVLWLRVTVYYRNVWNRLLITSVFDAKTNKIIQLFQCLP